MPSHFPRCKKRQSKKWAIPKVNFQRNISYFCIFVFWLSFVSLFKSFSRGNTLKILFVRAYLFHIHGHLCWQKKYHSLLHQWTKDNQKTDKFVFHKLLGDPADPGHAVLATRPCKERYKEWTVPTAQAVLKNYLRHRIVNLCIWCECCEEVFFNEPKTQ